MPGARRIGFVGLGAMGSGMAASLVRAGFEVRGYDVSAAAVEVFARAGGGAGRSPADVARDAELLTLVVATAEQAEAALFGEHGAVAALAAGATVALHATVPPSYAVAVAERLAATGHLYLDAPISGGTARAAAGTLTIMASGPPAAFETAGPALDKMAERVYRLGDTAGPASTVKMINQHLAGVHVAVAAEAIALGTRAGINPRLLFEVISNSAGNSWMFTNRVPHMLEGDYTPHSAVEIFVKDLGIVLDAAKALRFPLPIAAAAYQQYLAAAAAGFGRADDAAVLKVYERLSGVDVAAASANCPQD